MNAILFIKAMEKGNGLTHRKVIIVNRKHSFHFNPDPLLFIKDGKNICLLWFSQNIFLMIQGYKIYSKK